MTHPEATSDPARPAPQVRVGWLVRVAFAVVRHPSLWVVGIVSMRRLAAPGWWRRWPPVPAPPPEYLQFRAVTNTGTEDLPTPAETLRFLKWAGANRGVLG